MERKSLDNELRRLEDTLNVRISAYFHPKEHTVRLVIKDKYDQENDLTVNFSYYKLFKINYNTEVNYDLLEYVLNQVVMKYWNTPTDNKLRTIEEMINLGEANVKSKEEYRRRSERSGVACPLCGKEMRIKEKMLYTSDSTLPSTTFACDSCDNEVTIQGV
jgi:hypothetical protein